MKHQQEINSLFIQVFNTILKLEERYIQSQQSQTRTFSVTEAHIIEQIGLSGKRRMSEVAEDLKITISSLTLAINRLEKKGFVKRVKDQQDKRAVNLCLTETGKEIYAIHENFHRKLIEEVSKFFPREDDDLILAFVSKLNDFFQMLFREESLEK